MAGGPREWGSTVERGVRHHLWVMVKERRGTDANGRVLEGEEERAVFHPQTTRAAPDLERGKALGWAFAGLHSSSHSLYLPAQ